MQLKNGRSHSVSHVFFQFFTQVHYYDNTKARWEVFDAFLFEKPSSIILVNFTWKSNSPNSPNLPPHWVITAWVRRLQFQEYLPPKWRKNAIQSEASAVRNLQRNSKHLEIPMEFFMTRQNDHRNFPDFHVNLHVFTQMKKFISEMNIYKKRQQFGWKNTHLCSSELGWSLEDVETKCTSYLVSKRYQISHLAVRKS